MKVRYLSFPGEQAGRLSIIRRKGGSNLVQRVGPQGVFVFNCFLARQSRQAPRQACYDFRLGNHRPKQRGDIQRNTPTIPTEATWRGWPHLLLSSRSASLADRASRNRCAASLAGRTALLGQLTCMPGKRCISEATSGRGNDKSQWRF